MVSLTKSPEPRWRLSTPMVLAGVAVLLGGIYFLKPSSTSLAPVANVAPVQSQSQTPTPAANTPSVPSVSATPAQLPTNQAAPTSPQVAASPAAPQPSPTVNPDAMTSAERDLFQKELESEIDRLASPVKVWRDTLASLDPPTDATSTDVYKRLLQTRETLGEFATNYSQASLAVRTNPPATKKDLPAMRQKVIDAGELKLNGRDVKQVIKAASDDYPNYTKMLSSSKESRKKELTTLTEAVRAKSKDLLRAAEAADTHGYETTSEASKEVVKKLTEKRQELRLAIETMTDIERQVTAALPPDPKRLGELQERLQAISPTTGTWTEWADQVRPLAADVERVAKQERQAFEARKARLFDANIEAQWFICTDQNGKLIWVGDADRKAMTYEGKTPFLNDDPDHVIEFDNRTTPYGNYKHMSYPPLPFSFINEQKQTETGFISNNQNKDPLAFKYHRLNQDSWKFAYKAGTERQKYVPYNDIDPDLVERKRLEMVKMLAAFLNARFEGLNLTPENVFVTWKRVKSGSEKAVTLENMFGRGFQTGVIVPKEPPLGLVGQGDDAFRAMVNEARRLATGVSPDVRVKPSLAANTIWKGTLQQSGYNPVDTQFMFTEVSDGVIRGTLVTTQRGNQPISREFFGVVKGNDFTFITKDNGNGNGGFEYTGRINGDQVTGKFSGSQNGYNPINGSFTLTRQSGPTP